MSRVHHHARTPLRERPRKKRRENCRNIKMAPGLWKGEVVYPDAVETGGRAAREIRISLRCATDEPPGGLLVCHLTGVGYGGSLFGFHGHTQRLLANQGFDLAGKRRIVLQELGCIGFALPNLVSLVGIPGT